MFFLYPTPLEVVDATKAGVFSVMSEDMTWSHVDGTVDAADAILINPAVCDFHAYAPGHVAAMKASSDSVAGLYLGDLHALRHVSVGGSAGRIIDYWVCFVCGEKYPRSMTWCKTRSTNEQHKAWFWVNLNGDNHVYVTAFGLDLLVAAAH